MIGIRKVFGIVMAVAFAAIALPAVAHNDDTINLVMGVVGPNQLTASLKHNDNGDQMKSFKMPFGTNVQSVSVTSVTISPNPPSSMPTVSVTGTGASGLISVATGLSLNYGQTLKLTLAVTTTGGAGCGSTTSTWTATGWDRTNFGGEKYPLRSTGNVLTANINGACTLTYTAGAGGTISGTTPQTVAYGGSGTQVTAVPNTGYSFVGWSDGVLTAARTDASVTANKSVTASFAINTYTLSYAAAAGGSITGTTPQTVNYGASGGAVTAVPPTGYHFASWSDGSTANPRTDTNVTGNINVTASFAINTYTVSTMAGSNGSITPPTQQVNYNSTAALTVTPDAGYYVLSATGCGGALSGNTFTTGSVTGNCLVTANFALKTLTFAPSPISATSAAVAASLTLPGPVFSVTVGLVPPPADDTPVTLTAAVPAMAPTGTTCPVLGPTVGSQTANTVSGSATFANLTFTGSPGTCALTAKATGYPDAILTPFVVYAGGDLDCTNSLGNYSTSAGTGTGAFDGPLDPAADQAYVGDPLSWGLRRYTNLGGGCSALVNYTLTTGLDAGKPFTYLAYDKGSPPQTGNFKYVIVFPAQPITPWPELRPLVAWVVDGLGQPIYVPGLACLSDNPLDAPALVMPLIPDFPDFPDNASYPHGSAAKMCIAQVGWTPLGGGLVQFWVKVIDQADGYVKTP